MSAPQLTHQRTTIRKKVAALLLGKTEAGSRVWPSRVRHLTAGKLPAIGVYTLEEESRDTDESPRVYDRTITVVIECVAAADFDLDDALDILAAQVEAVLMSDESWGGVADDTSLAKTEIYLVADVEGDRPLGAVALHWNAKYETVPAMASPAVLDEFRTLHAEWDLGSPDPDGPDGVTDATDEATLEQED